MTRRDIIDRFHSLMDLYNTSYWNDSRATALLNTVKDKLAQEFTVNRTEQKYEFDSVEGQQVYQVPSTFVAHRWMYFNSSYNNVIKFYDGPESIYGPVADQTAEGVPFAAYIWGSSGRRELTIYPTFADDGIEVQWWFYGWPPDVAVNNDEPHLPIEWHPSIVKLMVAEQQRFDKIISVGDALIITEKVVRTLKEMDTTKRITSLGGRSGSVDDEFPSEEYGIFNVKFSGGAVGRVVI